MNVMALQLHKNYVHNEPSKQATNQTTSLASSNNKKKNKQTWTQSLMQIVGFIIVSFRDEKANEQKILST